MREPGLSWPLCPFTMDDEKLQMASIYPSMYLSFAVPVLSISYVLQNEFPRKGLIYI